MNRYYAVSGRVLGDEEDTVLAFDEPMGSMDDAYDRFMADMSDVAAREGHLNDDGEADVIVMAAMESESPIKIRSFG